MDAVYFVGGEDGDFSDEDRRDALISPKIAAIRKKLATLLPKIIRFEIDCPGSADRIGCPIINGFQLHIGAIKVKMWDFR